MGGGEPVFRSRQCVLAGPPIYINK